MPRAEPPREMRESEGSFDAERVSSVLSDLQQIQAARARAPRRSRARSSSGDMRTPLVPVPQQPEDPGGAPSPPGDTTVGSSYFSIAKVVDPSDRGGWLAAITWGLYALVWASVLLWMANTRSLVFADEGSVNILGTCGLVGAETQPTFDGAKYDFLHDKGLERWYRYSVITLTSFMFLHLVFSCYRGECALGETRIDGVRTNTNRSLKVARLVGWVGTAGAIGAVLTSPFVVFAGLSCGWATKKIFSLFAAVSASAAIVLGLIEVMNHMTNYYRPKLQRHISRVLLMVPIYAAAAMCTVSTQPRPITT